MGSEERCKTGRGRKDSWLTDLEASFVSPIEVPDDGVNLGPDVTL